MKQNLNLQKTRFSSSNSFLGFRSYFKDTFDSTRFDSIFVIKGNPGGGKSSAMKRCAEIASGLGHPTELIYCSSDRRSLDGVIIGGDKRIGILDGTAPHERDAVIPGAVDMLVNFGKCIKIEEIRKRRDEIIYLNSKKQSEYSNAYRELSFSYKYWINIKAEYKKSVNATKMKTAENLIRTVLSRPCADTDIRLLSSFSKDGYTHLDSPFDKGNIYSISGNKALAAMLCSILSDKIGKEKTAFLSPLDPEIYEGFADADGNCITIHAGADPLFASDEFFDITEERAGEIGYLTDNMTAHLNEARSHLQKASVYHFDIEEIYNPCMDFSALNEIVEDLVNKIKNILLY